MSGLRGLHVCAFRGERLPPPEAETVTGMMFDRSLGRMVEKTVVMPPPTLPRCEGPGKSGRGRCTKQSVGGARYPWGCMALCAEHLDEECGAEAQAGAGSTP